MKRYLSAAAIGVFLACMYAVSHAGTNAQSVSFLLSQVRAGGTALAGGKVYTYETGSSTPKAMWLNRSKSTQAANPYTLDANATAQLYGDGLYRIVIKDAAGVTKYDRDGLYFIDDASSFATKEQGDKADTYTASDVLAKVKTLDGAGSGLDADTLDGQHASYFTGLAFANISGSRLPAGSVVQYKKAATTALGTTAVVIPLDDTIPQVSEGAEVLSLSITPRYATSFFRVSHSCLYDATGATYITVALFKDAGANAIAATTFNAGSSNTASTIPLVHVFTPGSTNTVALSARVGPSNATTIHWNGRAGTRLFGGVSACTLEVTEITQ